MPVKTSQSYTHLVFDLYGCTADLLQSVDRGFELLRTICVSSALTPVDSYSMTYPNGGYSCGLLLSESHISLHTWPERTYCAVDIFVCSGDIEKAEITLLQQVNAQHVERISLLRGCGTSLEDACPGWIHSRRHNDYYEAFRASRLLLRHQSPYQLIEVFESASLGKVLMLDHDIQLATADEAAYHEYLAHPAMLAHPMPRTVLIVGGGDGGTLREVCRCQTIERIVLVDIDANVIDASRDLLPELNAGAFHDPRLSLIYQDAADYIGKEAFDIVLIDLTAPKGPSITAYERLAANLPSAVAPNGFVGIHSGWWASESLKDYPSQILNMFPKALLHNRWIDSFFCFWSFILAWRHETPANEVMRQIEQSRTIIGGKSFSRPDYLASIFTKPETSRPAI